VVTAGVFGVTRYARAGVDVPTAEVRKGEFVDYLQIRGDVKALKSTVLTAPSGSGDMQIINLAKNGSMVQAGDVVVVFDTTILQRNLERKETELKAAEAEIERARAQAQLNDEATLTESVSAGYNVERAKLDVSKQEVLSEIEGAKTRLLLANTEQKQREVEQKVKSGRIANDADIASKRQKRDKVLYDVREAQRQIASMTLKAPVSGMVTMLPNYRARGFFGGGSVPEFKEGDRAWPGAGVAELPDLASVRMAARVDETDRGVLKVGQKATVRVDAIPDKEFTGTLADISALAKVDFSSWPPLKNFDIAIQLDGNDPRLRPGMSATGRVAVVRIPDAIIIPAEAAFAKSGRTVVYVQRGRNFEERVIEIGKRGKNELMVAKGLQPGERVALKDPTQWKTEGK
jgi:multidrug resistance efflux pump